jgi:GntR family transcriptional regulator / MocR family aminotransferase
MRLFPHRQWARALARLCRANPAGLLEGHGPFGNPELRQAVARHVAEWRGLQASPAQIIITAGATDALELCMRTLARPGEGIALEDPGFLPMRAHASALGLVPQSLINDGQGALPGPGDARLVVLTPSHQFPLGGAMSPQRRQAFLHQTGARDSWIIEDDYDSEFRYAGRPIPAMAGFDGLQRSIYIGSFSKIFSNTLRLGYLIIPEGLRDRFQHNLQRFGNNASVMAQQPLAEFIASGEFYRHLRRMRRIYGERRKFLTARLVADFAAFGHFEDHQAGMQIAFHLQERLDDQAIARAATDLGLHTQPLSDYCSDNRDINGLLLGFCAFSEAEMQPALDQLHRLLSAY